MKSLTLLILLCVGASVASAQQSYTGGLLRQDFNTLPAAGSFDFQDIGLANIKGPYQLTAPPVSAVGATGWSVYARTGSPLQFKVDNGSSTSAAAGSFGPAASADRALGSLGSTHAANLGWRLINTTGQTITQFTLTYRGEQWRVGGSANVNKLDFAYRITSDTTIGIDGTSFTFFPSLDFTSPQTITGSGFSVNGNLSANSTERSATVSGISWPNNQLLILRWRDADETGSDDALAIDDVMFYAPTSTVTLPSVVSISPAHGTTRVLTTSPIVVSFNQPVNTTGTSFELTDSLGSPIPASVTNAGPMRYTLTPSVPFASGETVSVRVIGTQVTNASAQPMAADSTISFTTQPSSATLTHIHDVQGTEGYSPLTSAMVTVQGVVVADYQGAAPALGGFYLQETDADADSDPATSEGIWIADQSFLSAIDVSVGDVVQVTGTVSESSSLTQLVNLTAVTTLGTATLPAVTSVSLPTASSIAFERYEGMRVQFPQPLSVTSNSGSGSITDTYARFGELELSADGPLTSPTEIIDPNDSPASGTSITGRSNVPAIRAQENANALRSIFLDDASFADTPDPTPYLNAQGTRRVGDTVTGLSGILSFSNGAYRVQPTGPVPFVDTNPRPLTPPVISGRLKVAAMNVLNYFTTFGGTNDRGASNADEFQRQKDKVIAALSGLNADVLGLIEIQNTTTAVTDIVTALNAAVGSNSYSIVPNPNTTYSGDFIRTLLLYRSSKISLSGPCYSDTDPIWSTLRNPLAQVFTENSTGERFIVCHNHWKSKSSSGATGANRDENDGQAAFNDHRRQQATRILTWLQGICTTVGDNDVILMGDLNSLGEEDPLDILRNGGFTDQGTRFHPGDYSYRLGNTRGRLDHAFATNTMASQVSDTNHWHINADEPAFYDYNTEGKSPAHLAINVGTPFRSSDHDPVLIGLTLAPQPTTYSMWAAAGGISGAATDDSDHDGISNLMEFALAADPATSDAHLLPTVTATTNAVTLSYRQRTNASGLVLTPQWSEDLITWFDLTGSYISPFDATTALHQAMASAIGKTQIFMRLKATQP